MAVVVTFRIEGADQGDHDRLEAALRERIEAAGGPPEGLIVHLAHPDDDGGFVAVEVFRNEATFRAFWSSMAEPALAAVGLTAELGVPVPVWSLARP